MILGGGGERMVVVARVGDKEGGGVKPASLYLFSGWATFRTAALVISPAMQKDSS